MYLVKNGDSMSLPKEQLEYFSMDSCVLGLIKKAVDKGNDLSIRHETFGNVYVLASKGLFFGVIKREEEFYTAPQNQFRTSSLSSAEVQAILRNSTNCRPVEDLLWQSAHFGSRGRLLEGYCQSIDVIELDHWPNLTRLSSTPNAVSMAALLNRHPSSLKLAARMLNVSASEMATFYSAARASGIARPINRKDEIQEPKEVTPHQNRGLLAKLFAKASSL